MLLLFNCLLSILFIGSTLTTPEASGKNPYLDSSSFTGFSSDTLWDYGMGLRSHAKNKIKISNSAYRPPPCPNNDQFIRKYYCDKSRVSHLNTEQYAKLEQIIETIRTRGDTCNKLAGIGSLLLSEKGIVVAKIDPTDRVNRKVLAFLKIPEVTQFFPNEGRLMYLDNTFITLDPLILDDTQTGHYKDKIALEWVFIHLLDHILLKNQQHIPFWLEFGVDSYDKNFTLSTENINTCISKSIK